MIVVGNAIGQELQQKVSDYFLLQTLYPQEKIYLHLDKNYYAAGERIYWKGYLVDAVSHLPKTKSHFMYVELVDYSDNVLEKYKVKKENDLFYGSILLRPGLPAGAYYIRAYTQWMINAGTDYFYYHKLRIGNALDKTIQSAVSDETSPVESKKSEFALSFFPEGGDLLAGCFQRVAFKAQRADGTYCAVRGMLMDEVGDTLVSFRTEHDGMGAFTFSPSANTSYKVKVLQDSTAVYREFALPAVKIAGRQLSVNHRKGVVNYGVLQASQDIWDKQDTLFLIGHTRGEMNLFLPLTADQSTGRFTDADLSEGITELLLVNCSGQVLSRRLILVTFPDLAELTMDALPSELSERRKLVEIPLHFTDKQGQPLQTNFSVSLTDESLVTPDGLTDNIRSTFLLVSELKGYIENPGYYFLRKDTPTEYHTELLLLTHGWSRFKHDNIAELPTVNIDYFMEAGQTISGKANTLLGRKAKDVPVVLMAPDAKISAIANTDAEGNFIFEGIDFCDTVTFVVQGVNKHAIIPVFLKIDSVPYIPPHNPFPSICVDGNNQRLFQLYDRTIRDSYLNEAGLREIHLEEVTVTASKRPAGPAPLSAFSYHVSGDKLSAFGATTAYDAVLRMPGVGRFSNAITLSGEKTSPLFIISQMRYESEDAIDALQSVDILDVVSIEIMKSTSAVFLGPDAAGGAIIVNLKTGAEVKAKQAPGLALFTMQGYSKAVEFYHPVYETSEQINNEKKDIRTTVYWNPDLQTDENGKAVIRFYTPDNLIKPHFVIEGIAPSGYLMRFER